MFSSTNDKLLLEIDHTIAIVSEYMEPGSLRDVIANGGLDNVGYHLILKLALQAAKGDTVTYGFQYYCLIIISIT